MVLYGMFLWDTFCFGCFLTMCAGQMYYGKLIGEFNITRYAAKGSLYAADENTLVIVGFSFDGGGPGAFFWIGENENSYLEDLIVPDEKGSTEVLKRYINQDLVLKLPNGKRIQDQKLFSVMHRRFGVSGDLVVEIFGKINIPDNFEPPKEQVLGSLPTLAHGVRSGPLIVKDEKTIVIPDLHYDGAAPDAFFLVGNGSKPKHYGAVKVPHDQQSDLRILQGYRGQNVTLKLPNDLTVFNIDWLSIYCITFQENFGHLFFPKNLNVPPVISDLVKRTLEGSGKVQKRYLGKYLGELQPSQHGVKGSVYVADENTFVIDGFYYDGAGPDAYFWADTMPSPTAQGLLVPNEQNSSDILKSYANKTLVLTVPFGKKVQDFQSFGVWCRQANVDFGHVRIPSNLEVPEKQTLEWLSGGPFTAEFVVITDSRTIELHQVEYTVPGVDLFFYAGNGPSLTVNNFRLQNDAGDWDKINLIPSSQRIVRVKLPENRTFFEFQWFSVYCPSCRRSYGVAYIPPNLNIPPDLTAIKAQALNFENCEELFPGKLQVSWNVINEDIYLQLVGKRGYNEYFAFGISGHPTLSKMVGSDVTVVFYDTQQQTARAVDYNLNDKAQCSNESGSCPDVKSRGRNDVVLQSWKMSDDILSVIFKRPLTTGDPLDQIYRLNESTAVVAAVGPLNSLTEVAFHTNYYNKNPISIHFGRSPTNNCKTLIVESTDKGMNLWPAAKIEGVNVFTAQIGPTGGNKGYTAITGKPSWGLAWWINGKMVPEVTVVRGRNYTFVVEGGNNPSIPTSYHPLYITNNAEGGGAQFLKDINSPDHIAYAGLKKDNHENWEPIGVGHLCEFKHISGVDMADSVDSFEDYKKTLKLECLPGNSGEFSWVPDENTPDTVYYQCFTHRNLGWKIRVVSGDTNGGKSVFSNALMVELVLVFWLLLGFNA